MSEDNRLKTVRALIAKAESLENEEEAILFMEKAQALMLKYAIDEATLNRAAPQRSKPIKREIEFNGTIHGWGARRELLLCIATYNRCMALFMRDVDGTLCACELYGFESDVNYVELLYTSLSVQMENAYLRSDHSEKTVSGSTIKFGQAVEMSPGGRLNPASLKNWRSEFFAGFVGRVSERLRPVSVQGEPSVALVLKERTEEVKQFYTEENKNTQFLPARREQTIHNELARMAGGHAANNADFGANVSSSGRKALN